jgi:hypothetical protein
MLRDSLADECAGHHIEQVEIRFAPGVDSDVIATAWADTVAMTEALRISFLIEKGVPLDCEFVRPPAFPQAGDPLPDSWASWLESDRKSPLIAPQVVPWRAVLWQEESRFLWTFHHALLDGRSITRILRSFLDRVAGRQAPPLALARWHPPSQDALQLAATYFQNTFSGFELVHRPMPDCNGPAVRCLGQEILTALESRAEAEKVTPGTILIWAWGQALAEISNTGSVMVEQIRSGAPRPGTAGFSMNTLPLLIHRSTSDAAGNGLRELRDQLLSLRAIEAVSPEDFAPGIFPDMDGPAGNVIMIERGTFQHSVNIPGTIVTSLTLHERVGESLMATAHLLPDLRLEVEGPGRHLLLHAWIEVLSRLLSAIR